jgi:hypothetical protein
MSTFYSDIVELHKTSSTGETNSLIKSGWILIDSFISTTEIDPYTYNQDIVFILGRTSAVAPYDPPKPSDYTYDV